MKLYDKIMGSGLAAAMGAYYFNKDIHNFTDDIGLEGELYDWTMGKFPEFFTAAVGQRVIEGFLERLGIQNRHARRSLAFGASLAAGTLEEAVMNGFPISDVGDLFAYGAGAAASVVAGYVMDEAEPSEPR